jgi:hypothetical protein
MATGASPALDPKAETRTQTTAEAGKTQPKTLKERIVSKLTEIFAGREEYAGWRQ